MNNLSIRLLAAIGLGTLLLGIALGVGWQHLYKFTSTTPSQGDAAGEAKQEPNVLYWYDPMVPDQHFAFTIQFRNTPAHQFLANPPADGIGLTVPAMPVGSPGMEVGDKFMPYRVLLMKKDGSTEVFASVESAAQQVQPLQQPEAQP
jgi:hypothetical protein